MASAYEVAMQLLEGSRIVSEAPAAELHQKVGQLGIADIQYHLRGLANSAVGLQKGLEEASNVAFTVAQHSEEALPILEGAYAGADENFSIPALNATRRMGSHAMDEADILVSAHDKTVAIGYALRTIIELTKDIDNILGKTTFDADNAVAAQQQSLGQVAAYTQRLGSGQ